MRFTFTCPCVYHSRCQRAANILVSLLSVAEYFLKNKDEIAAGWSADETRALIELWRERTCRKSWMDLKRHFHIRCLTLYVTSAVKPA